MDRGDAAIAWASPWLCLSRAPPPPPKLSAAQRRIAPKSARRVSRFPRGPAYPRYQRAAAGAHGSPSAGELGPTWTAALALDGAPPRWCVGPPSTVDRVSLGGDSVS